MGKYVNQDIINKIEKEKENNNTLQNLGQQLAQEKLTNIQKDNIINGLGQQVANLKLQIIQIQGGTN
jgi:hypothetical protein